MAEVPPTDEGWYVLHDFRTIDWDEWRETPAADRQRAIDEGVDYLTEQASVEEGTTAVFSIIGHKADLLVLHLRPTLDAVSTAERAFERTALAGVTDQPTSYVSVTEVSGYVSDDYFQEDGEVDAGLERYIEGKLKPELPDDEYVSFYPMSKRRGEEYNWYDLSFDERAEMMAVHGETGKQYAGKIKQIISSSVGFDDYEWGVTLFAGEPTDIKDIVYEMRFDDVSSKYGEFGSFYVGRRFPAEDLGAYLAGETVPTGDAASGGHHHGKSEGHHHGHGDADSHHGDSHSHGESDDSHGEAHGGDHHEEPAEEDPADEESIRGELADLDIYAGKPHGEDVYATVLYSEADTEELFEEVDGLRSNFDHYDTHVKTAVYGAQDGSRRAVVSIWETASAADTAAGFLSELPEIVERAGEESGFGTMGMFYTVKPDSREDFVEKFDTVGDVLEEIDGHMETDLMVNHEDDNDMFIASQWESQEDAMGFFGSEAFRDTVEWGRDVLADRPRHVFLA
jgi:chlorite dismutase